MSDKTTDTDKIDDKTTETNKPTDTTTEPDKIDRTEPVFDIVYDDPTNAEETVEEIRVTPSMTAGGEEDDSPEDQAGPGQAEPAEPESDDETDDETGDKTDDETDEPSEPKVTADDPEAEQVEHAASAVDRELKSRKDTFTFKTYPTLALKHVSVAAGRGGAGGDVLHDVSLEFYQRRTHAVLVSSEAERMAVTGLLAGIVRPTDGKVQFKSQDLHEYTPQEFRGHFMGFIPQRGAVRTDWSAVRNLVAAMDASNRNFLRPKPILAEQLLQQVDFPEEMANKPLTAVKELDRRRAAIARALSCEPSVILADEPTSQLGEETAETVWDLLSGLTRHDDYCVIIVTEDRDLANRADVTYEI
ncbi:ATP-binding cassette domain-containing protein [Bifidobacterium simiarum]|uniref:ABC transporter domain-containing protein n=1 Tax=Bifidobacterium simiarum TaxID=2045441 RepID=A0A2M9HG96_9BIFI|nr:ATP-binding cassette domain-containing protein [Bifidobacterium simiarum]PJM75819.1 hypothetical protein CSQ87_02825 [Bifidobacterium simiarum]